MPDGIGKSPVADYDVPQSPLSHIGNRANASRSCVNCEAHVPLMHNSLCPDCDSVEAIRDAWADQGFGA